MVGYYDRFRLILILLFILSIYTTISIAADENATSMAFYVEKDFWAKITLVIITAILSFLVSYALWQIKKRKEPKRQLSYDLGIKKGLVEVEKDIKDKVTVLYNNQKIEDLYHVSCNVENTGNLVIKNNYIRFEFNQEIEIMEFFFEPKPEREMGVEEDLKTELETCEKRFIIKHLDRNQQVGFHFILASSKEVRIKLHPFNEEVVDFVPRSISKVSNQKEQITSFVTLYLLFLLLPSALYIVPFFGTTAADYVRVAILIIIYPFIKPFAQAIADMISKFLTEKAVQPMQIGVHDSKNISIISNSNENTQTLKISEDKDAIEDI